MAPSRFDGRQLATAYEYDEDGLLVRSVADAEWTEQDRAWMLALHLYRSRRCPCGCGLDVRDTTAPEGTHRWKVRKVRCLARDALALAQAQHKANRPEAVLWRVEKE